MAKSKHKKGRRTSLQESDSAYFLKLVLYVVVGSQWIWLVRDDGSQIPLPFGLVIGLIFASHDHFKIDRKVEYALLLVAALLAFWAQIGIYINL